MTPLPEIARCKCGRGPFVYTFPWLDFGNTVRCLRGHCWIGPHRKTPRAAINAWNKVMEQKP